MILFLFYLNLKKKGIIKTENIFRCWKRQQSAKLMNFQIYFCDVDVVKLKINLTQIDR